MGRGWSYETPAFALGVKSVFYQLWGCCGFAAASPGLVLFFRQPVSVASLALAIEQALSAAIAFVMAYEPVAGCRMLS